jgi:hypothetical protein
MFQLQMQLFQHHTCYYTLCDGVDVLVTCKLNLLCAVRLLLVLVP